MTQPDTRSTARVIDDITRQLGDLPHAALIRQALADSRHASPAVEVGRAGSVLMDAGLTDDGAALYLAATRSLPDHPAGFIGLAQLAMRRRNWAEARRRWDIAVQSFPSAVNGFWLGARALVGYELGLESEAAAEIVDLLQRYPGQVAGAAATAQLALRRCAWSEGLARFDEMLEEFAAHPAAVQWRLQRAAALIELGRVDEAALIADEIAGTCPRLLAALLLRLRVHVRRRCPQSAWTALATSPLRQIDDPALIERRLDLLLRLGEQAAACAFFMQILACVERPETLESLFQFTPRLYEGVHRREILASLRERSSRSRASADAADEAAFGVLDARIALALRDPTGVMAATARLAPHGRLGEPGETLRRIGSALRTPGFSERRQPKIFGIGLSRTGTTSLAAALTLLGFHTLHWRNALTGEVIGDDDLPLFDAFLDTPISARFEQLYHQYPDSKFIYTVRRVDAWLVSMAKLWRQHLSGSDFDTLKAELASPGGGDYGNAFREINHRLYFAHESFSAAYAAHEQRVRQFFQDKPADRLLTIDITADEGWPRLCAFLGREVPAAPFPWHNRAVIDE